jgi:hypothetical protein
MLDSWSAVTIDTWQPRLPTPALRATWMIVRACWDCFALRPGRLLAVLKSALPSVLLSVLLSDVSVLLFVLLSRLLPPEVQHLMCWGPGQWLPGSEVPVHVVVGWQMPAMPASFLQVPYVQHWIEELG